MTTEFINIDSNFFRMAMDSCHELVFVKDHDFKVIYANKSMLGLYPPELRAGVIGSTTIENFSKDEAEVFLAKDKEAFSTGSSSTIEEIVSYTGHLRTFSVNKTLFEDTEGRIRLFGVATDISELVDRERKVADANTLLQESEARFRLITEQASDVISLHDTDGRTLFMSPAIRAIIGYEPEELLGQTMWAYVLPEDHDILVRHRVQLTERSFGDTSTSRFRMVHRDGSVVWVEVGSRLTEYDGEQCSIAVCRDVTTQVAVETALQEARREAELATAAKSSFLATMSHEVRTPMTGVLGMVELLRTDIDPTQRDRFFDTLEQSAKTLMTVLDDILDFSKIEAGNLTLEAVDFDLAALAHSVGDLFGNAASAKGLTLTVQAPAAVIGVNGDPTRIRQILSNLVSNAIKFTEAGSIAIALASAKLSSQGDRWRIEVIDTGIGVDPAASEQLFSPFVQADLSTTRQFGGTGLGLAISKRLATAMGGDIGVSMREGGGSIFWFDVPLKAVQSAALGTALRLSIDPDHKQASAPLRVLIAEDNEINQLLVTTLLRRLGHEPVCVVNGQLAVAEVEQGYDVILMDMQMPIMDGVAATRAIRSLPGAVSTIPIIALTADALPERRRFYENIGLTGFLTKPIDVVHLATALRGIEVRQKVVSPEPTAIDAERLAELRVVLGGVPVPLLPKVAVAETTQYQRSTRRVVSRCSAKSVAYPIVEVFDPANPRSP